MNETDVQDVVGDGTRVCAVCGGPIAAGEQQVVHDLVVGLALFEHVDCCEEDR